MVEDIVDEEDKMGAQSKSSMRRKEQDNEEEIRIRRHSPKTTFPLRRKNLREDSIKEASRRVNPKFQNSKEIERRSEEEEAKMYLYC